MPEIDLVLIVGAKDEASKVIGGLANNVKKHGKAIGLGLTGAGAAGLALVDASKELTAQLKVTASQLDVNADELRNLTLETANVTFPIEEVTASFDLLTRAGIENADELAKVATEMDTLGDAIGKPASEVTAKLVPALKAFGIELQDVGEHTDAFTFLTRNTTIGLDEFSAALTLLAPDLQELGLSMDDTVAIMVALEKKGISGAAANRAFSKAVSEARKGEVDLVEALGLTTEEIEAQTLALEESNGITQEFADLANEQFSIVDKLKHGFSEFKVRVGAMLEPFEGVFAVMSGLGPIITAMSTSIGQQTIKWIGNTASMLANKAVMIAHKAATIAATAAQWALNAALTANPIGLVITAVAGLIAIVITLTDSWGKVVDFFKDIWGKLVDLFQDHWEKILLILFPPAGIIALFVENWGKIKDFFADMWNSILDTTKDVFIKIGNAMLDPIKWTVNKIIDGINWLIDQLNKIHFEIPDWVPFIGGNEFGINISPVPHWLQEGGIVTRPTVAGLGEAGPEAVIPLDRFRAVLNQGTTIVNVFLNGDEVSDLVVEKVSTELKLQGVVG